jgi:hypothetical protein
MLAFLSALAVAPVVAGCAANKVYDQAYNDYHTWNSQESAQYKRWEAETQRAHLDYDKRPLAEQREYWSWRHGQLDRAPDAK